MKIYKVSFYDNWKESRGFQFASSEREAQRLKRDYLKSEDVDGGEVDADIQAIFVTPTKSGIISALNYHGGHPDNG